MKITEKRKVIRQGKYSRALILPPWWIKFHEMQPGDVLEVSSENGELTLVPKKHSVEKTQAACL